MVGYWQGILDADWWESLGEDLEGGALGDWERSGDYLIPPPRWKARQRVVR